MGDLRKGSRILKSCNVLILSNPGGEKMDDNVASGYQFRHRRILSNASADGTECPALSQLRRCHTEWGDACSRWEVQPLLDTCHLASNATCGLGYHELVFRCRRYDGVSPSFDYPAHRISYHPESTESSPPSARSLCFLSQIDVKKIKLSKGSRMDGRCRRLPD